MKHELLAPAGNLEKLKYALAYGADAIYAGAPQFSLRARENGFQSIENLVQGVEYAHQLGKKFYLTVNIIAPNRKIQTFRNKMDALLSCRPDALIMADPGMIDMVKQKYPEIPIHLSVQANVMNWAAAKFWHKLGISRIIMSRELSIDDIKQIKDNVPELEVEAFVHGAICIAHSGRCLLSNYFSYRDANQGVCTNACRWKYKIHEESELAEQNFEIESGHKPFEGRYFLEEADRPGEFMEIDEDEHGTYIMNAKDLMAIEYLREMSLAGVESFKIEGRTKSIYYLSMVTRAYRRAIDDLESGREFDASLVQELKKIHHRGYTPGFLVGDRSSENQRYDEGTTNLFSQEFAGEVIATKQNKILLQPRNRLKLGDQLELISPQGTTEFQVSEMILEDGQSVDVIHGGTARRAWIPVDQNGISEFALASRIVTPPQSSS